MSLINTKIKPFKNQAFKNGEFIEVTEKDTEGRWSVFFFYPADFTFVCPTELGDVADHYEELQKLGVDVYSVSTDTHFTHKACTAALKPSPKSNMRWNSATRLAP
ncbi:alkyl hydroperoxide reductase protein C [Klebsiella pneumoniae]|uniref:Alkyl hydroperoxide reductase C n=1 Tax=Klebsiella pneumoniae TaxID=573 RepID=A0A2X3EGD5_KLEPN|nr:alkyl hydroperoxide reductase protein C [Klebsiella pneumoniae]